MGKVGRPYVEREIFAHGGALGWAAVELQARYPMGIELLNSKYKTGNWTWACEPEKIVMHAKAMTNFIFELAKNVPYKQVRRRQKSRKTQKIRRGRRSRKKTI